MRFYSFVNANYLKHIQHGIQSFHALHEMYDKYMTMQHDRLDIVKEWAKYYKTVIVLDGGDHQDLQEIADFLRNNDTALGLPHSRFHEDVRSLNGSLTAVGIVVPANIYDVVKVMTGQAYTTQPVLTTDNNIKISIPSPQEYQLNYAPYEFKNSQTKEFYNLLKSKPLAR